jgi:hypothetical protein
MKYVTVSVITLLFVGGLFLSGCSTAPTAEFDAALAALDSADQVEADLYVADLYQAAQDSFAAAQAELEEQNAKSALTRDYSHVAELISFVQTTAMSAIEQVETRKEELFTNTQNLIAEAQAAVATARELAAKAPRSKDKVALVAITEDAGDAEALLKDAITALEQGDVLNANQLAQNALEKAKALIDELNGTSESTPQAG